MKKKLQDKHVLKNENVELEISTVHQKLLWWQHWLSEGRVGCGEFWS